MPPAMPVPVTAIFCGPLGSGSPILRVAVKVPAVTGLKVKVNVQDEFPGTLVPQVFVSLKGPFDPVQEMLKMGRADAPTFWNVAVIGLLVVPTAVFGKVNDEGVMSTAVPVPLITSPCFDCEKFPS